LVSFSCNLIPEPTIPNYAFSNLASTKTPYETVQNLSDWSGAKKGLKKRNIKYKEKTKEN
jgi:hypothetical protein